MFFTPGHSSKIHASISPPPDRQTNRQAQSASAAQSSSSGQQISARQIEHSFSGRAGSQLPSPVRVATPVESLAELTFTFATAGIDVIKDDHGRADDVGGSYDRRDGRGAAARYRAE